MKISEATKRTKPCPFCGSKQIELVHDGGTFYIECNECGARTASGIPFAEGSIIDEILNKWNRRDITETCKDGSPRNYEDSECESTSDVYVIIKAEHDE